MLTLMASCRYIITDLCEVEVSMAKRAFLQRVRTAEKKYLGWEEKKADSGLSNLGFLHSFVMNGKNATCFREAWS